MNITLKADEVTLPRINTDGLHETLAETFGESRFLGISTGNGEIVFHFKDDAGEAEKTIILGALANHDPAKLTQRQRDQQNRAEAFTRLVNMDMETLRGNPDGVIDVLKDIQLLMRGTVNG